MTTFVDTSALYAILDADDQNHRRAALIWKSFVENSTPMVTSNYVVIEASALVQHRLGVEALQVLHEALLPLVWVQFVDSEGHAGAVHSLLVLRKRDLSLVDCVSFVLMRNLAIQEAFAFDRHFREQGFRLSSV